MPIDFVKYWLDVAATFESSRVRTGWVEKTDLRQKLAEYAAQYETVHRLYHEGLAGSRTYSFALKESRPLRKATEDSLGRYRDFATRLFAEARRVQHRAVHGHLEIELDKRVLRQLLQPHQRSLSAPAWSRLRARYLHVIRAVLYPRSFLIRRRQLRTFRTAVRQCRVFYWRLAIKRFSLLLARWVGALTGLLLGALAAVAIAIVQGVVPVHGALVIAAALVAFVIAQFIDWLFIKPVVRRVNWRIYWHWVWTLLTIGAICEVRLAFEKLERPFDRLREMWP